MTRRGRPYALDDVKRGEIVALISAGCSITDAARYVGCSVNTINRDAFRDRSFHKRMREAYLAAELKPLQSLRQAATHHWRAAAWLLKRVNPDRYERQREGTYSDLDFQDFMDQLLSSLGPEIPDRAVWERVARRFNRVRKRWEHERAELRAMRRPQDRRQRRRASEPDKPFPLLGHAVYKAAEKEPQTPASGDALATCDADFDQDQDQELIGVEVGEVSAQGE